MAVATQTLALADGLTLPVDAATQTFAFIARKGAGKTYAAGKLTELLVDAGVQVVVLDTVGNWYGLRIAADGKGEGLDIPVLGGLRGDIPLNAAAGELVADLVVDTGRSLVVDLSQFSKADRKRFATAFAERLWQGKKGELDPTPMHLVIEESQLLIPQNVTAGDARMVGVFEEIVRLGRNYGIGVSLISQRPQSVNKEALTQTECLVVLQVNGTPERKALREWVVDHDVPVDLLTELPGLPVGTAYVWSPQWLRFLGKVKIAPKRTFDASATPRLGERRIQRAPKPLDLAALQERMASIIEQAQANDPAALRQRVAALERQLRQQPPQVQTVEVERIVEVRVPTITTEQLARITSTADALQDAADRLRRLRDELDASAALAPARPISPTERQNAPVPAMPRVPVAHRRTPPVAPVPRSSSPNGSVTAPQLRILDALAALRRRGLDVVSKSNVAVFADQSPRSSGFANNLGALRSRGCIDYPVPGMVAITAQGLEYAAVDPSPLGSLTDLHAAWQAKLSGPQWRILSALIDRYPSALDRADLAQRAGQSVTSSGFANSLGSLRSLGLLDYPSRGQVAATELLFPVGLASAG